MKPDKRKNWSYNGCNVFPIDCYNIGTNWGKSAEPIRFRTAYKSRYWRIDFPDDSHVHVETKQDAVEYINLYLSKITKQYKIVGIRKRSWKKPFAVFLKGWNNKAIEVTERPKDYKRW